MNKRILSVILVICICLATMPAAVDAAEAGVFTDVSPADWYYDGVQYAYAHGMMDGTGNDLFSPNGVTTRAMIVTILHRMEGKPELYPASFADVSRSSYYASAVAWAAANGIVTGYSEEQFGPNDPITREQMAAILYRYAAYKGYDVSGRADLRSYNDSSRISSYALDAMAWANQAGLITGVSDVLLSPGGHTTRAQTAVILSRFCVQVAGDAVEDSKTETDEEAAEKVPEKAPDTPSYSGVAAEDADPNAQNLFLLSAAPAADGSTVEVTLTLCGDVELCGFDLQLLYNDSAFSVRELDTNCDLAVFAAEENGKISFNYAAATNITKEKTVLKVTFGVDGELDSDAVFSMNAQDVIFTDMNNGYDVAAAAYTLTYCTVG